MCEEEQLLAGARRVDQTALAQIHDCFYEQIYRYARYRTSDVQIAEDVAAEVFLRFLDGLQRGSVPRQSLRGWLFGTASHIVSDHFRRHYQVRDEKIVSLTRSHNIKWPENAHVHPVVFMVEPADLFGHDLAVHVWV